MKTRGSMFAAQGCLLIPALLLVVPAGAATKSLDELCPIEWRNVPLHQAMEELSGRFHLPVLFDESVTPELSRTPVRLFTRHLTGMQAIRWLARWAGLDAVFVEGGLLVARPERLPSIWQGEMPLSAASQPAPGGHWKAVRDRTADLEWVDAPLSLVSRDVSLRFGLDLIVHPGILKEEILVNYQQVGATLAQVCDAIAGQLNAAVDWVDGALWVYPRPHAAQSGPAPQPLPAPPPTTTPDATDVLFKRQLTINSPPADWETFGRILAGSGGVGRPMQIPPGTRPPGFTARGTAREILEAAKLLGRLDYHLEPSGTGKDPVLLIKVR